jgi:(S)-ureidoglycine aminohydrolase
MRQSFGETRSAFHRRHALISADSHERVTLPHWPDCGLVHLITPALGAEFTLFLVTAETDAEIGPQKAGVERFVLRREGRVSVEIEGGEAETVGEEGYVYLPADCAHRLRLDEGAVVLVLERNYCALADTPAPGPTLNAIPAHTAQPMKGDDRLMLQKLLPEVAGFDMEINVMDFAPGASLPYVETHFMEHGLVLLNGGGIYRLENEWYPVDAGDAIWMGPYCPQWFGAIGRRKARYLIYKNWNRDPLG